MSILNELLDLKRDQDTTFDFDLEQMTEAVQSPSREIPIEVMESFQEFDSWMKDEW